MQISLKKMLDAKFFIMNNLVVGTPKDKLKLFLQFAKNNRINFKSMRN